ncbi:hypothetical protein RHECNPAF_1340085 [Rhizobium etli CNPAF512]|nr:hypothetical protein RHECNPAF_1340085 [Rhizobium etli CNPAF512]
MIVSHIEQSYSPGRRHPKKSPFSSPAGGGRRTTAILALKSRMS